MADEDDSQGADAAEAFEAMRGELALLRRAVEGLAAERALVDVPDYTETLGVISHNLSATAQRVDALVKSPALSLTPEEISRQIDAASFTARREDHRLFLAAKQELEDMTRELRGIVVSARHGDEQNRWLAFAAIGGAIVGIVLWALFGGMIARATPDSWQWPESMATRTLGGTAWEGARRLAVASYPDTWNAMVASMAIGQGSQAALERCQQAANKAGEPVRCKVRIKPEERRAAQ